MDLFNSSHEPALPPPPIEEIAKEAIRDISQVFQFKPDSWLYTLMERLLKTPATKFATLMRSADLKVGSQSLWEAARDLLPQFSGGWNLHKEKEIPKEGPLLVIANHPGNVDSVATLAALERTDVHMVANDRPILRALPNTSEHLFYLDPNDQARFDVLRGLVNLLNDGQTVVLFPSGCLEPDPALYAGGLESLKKWSESLGVLLSKVPETMVQLILTQNVLTKEAWEHPITRLGKTDRRKHQIGMILQIIVQSLFDRWKLPINMTMPEPIPAESLSPSMDWRSLNTAIKEYVGAEMEKTFEIL